MRRRNGLDLPRAGPGVRSGVCARGGRPHEAAGAVGAGVGAVACVDARVGGAVVFAGKCLRAEAAGEAAGGRAAGGALFGGGGRERGTSGAGGRARGGGGGVEDGEIAWRGRGGEDGAVREESEGRVSAVEKGEDVVDVEMGDGR